MLTEFCQKNTLVIANTIFQQHKPRLYTQTSPDGQYQNQIDYILCRTQQEYTEQYRKDLHDPDNHDDMITHLEPDILECKVKQDLGRITMNKASGGDGIPAELFQILKDNAVKVLLSICQQIWKTQQWPQDWKRSVFIRVPEKSNAKECSKLH